MVDPDPGHRPRRAVDPTPDAGGRGRTAPALPRRGVRPRHPAPLPTTRPGSPGPTSGPGPAASPTTTTRRPCCRAPRRPAPRPRPRGAARRGRPPARLLGRRGRLALLVGGDGRGHRRRHRRHLRRLSVGDPAAGPGGAGATSSTAPSASTAAPTEVLADAALLAPASAAPIAAGPWTVALTQRPPAEDAPTAACLGAEPLEGQPAAQQEVVRLLSSSGAGAPSVLHHAAAYATPEDAAQAYAVTAKALGGCAAPGAYITDGSTSPGSATSRPGWWPGRRRRQGAVAQHRPRPGGHRSTSSTPRRRRRPLGVRGWPRPWPRSARPSARRPASRARPSRRSPTARRPSGGDVPRLPGDRRPAARRPGDEAWVATPAEPPSEDFLGSQCETVTWTRLGAASTSSRVYLVPSSRSSASTTSCLTMKDEKAATALVAKIRSDLDSCEKRKLTATVSDPRQVTGVGRLRGGDQGLDRRGVAEVDAGHPALPGGHRLLGHEGGLHLPEPPRGRVRRHRRRVGRHRRPRRAADDPSSR